MAGAPFPVPAAAELREAFSWSEGRTVRKTATVSLHGNLYQVDPSLAGRKVELVFDPFDLTVLGSAGTGGTPGTATAVPDQPPLPPQSPARGPAGEPAPATGIDYLGLIDARHTPSSPARSTTPPSPAARTITVMMMSPAPATGSSRDSAPSRRVPPPAARQLPEISALTPG